MRIDGIDKQYEDGLSSRELEVTPSEQRPFADMGVLKLSQDKAWIFRITHIRNLSWMLTNGLHCCNSTCQDPDFYGIGNRDLIGKRTSRPVEIPPGGTLGDYVPFYFTPYSPMLLNIKTGRNGVTMRPMTEIAILVTSLHRVRESGLKFVFTDRHAYIKAAQFSSELRDLNWIEWDMLRRRDFKRDLDDPGKFERYQAEALVHRHVPMSAILGVACYDQEQAEAVENVAKKRNVSITVKVIPGWYF